MSANKYWLGCDLETTGLGFYEDNPQFYKDDAVLEVGAILVEVHSLEVVDSFTRVVDTSEDKLSLMGDFVRQMHTDNGLLDEIRAGNGSPVGVVDAEFDAWLGSHGLVDNVTLFGSSVKLDYEFLRRHFPLVFSRLFYRVVDVSSFKVAFSEWLPEVSRAVEVEWKLKHGNESSHRALSDILATVDELKVYKSRFR